MWETCNHVCSLSKEVGEDNSVLSKEVGEDNSVLIHFFCCINFFV
ncbi:hypothetical protein HanPSC8_Chr10g0413021 [Helianthus annuus]|nr:hypothetical protein HanPSC8_Chr10g0413021 [Helianthus annuus]